MSFDQEIVVVSIIITSLDVHVVDLNSKLVLLQAVAALAHPWLKAVILIGNSIGSGYSESIYVFLLLSSSIFCYPLNTFVLT